MTMTAQANPSQTNTPLYRSRQRRNVITMTLAYAATAFGLIWLALSGYVKDDIDSVIGSFYLGLYWLESGMARL